MILRDKGISDETALKMVAKLMKRNPSSKGFKVKTLYGVSTITYDELIQFVTTLAGELAAGNYEEIHRCKTCTFFNYPGKKGANGCCFPKNFTSSRKMSDFCSAWAPMTEQQSELRRNMDARFGTLQTKRVGDGPEDSSKGD